MCFSAPIVTELLLKAKRNFYHSNVRIVIEYVNDGMRLAVFSTTNLMSP